jgi:hypothetical protein
MSWEFALLSFSFICLLALLVGLSIYGYRKNNNLTDNLSQWINFSMFQDGISVGLYVDLIFDRIIASSVYTKAEVESLKSAIADDVSGEIAKPYFGIHREIGSIYREAKRIRTVGLKGSTGDIIQLLIMSRVFSDSEIARHREKLIALVTHTPNIIL